LEQPVEKGTPGAYEATSYFTNPCSSTGQSSLPAMFQYNWAILFVRGTIGYLKGTRYHQLVAARASDRKESMIRGNTNVALITGAGRGLGQAFALALAAHGFKVAVTAHTEAQIDATADQIERAGGRAIAIPDDVTSQQDVERTVAITEAELGPGHHITLRPPVKTEADTTSTGTIVGFSTSRSPVGVVAR
jgi:short chain dehydrogenase